MLRREPSFTFAEVVETRRQQTTTHKLSLVLAVAPKPASFEKKNAMFNIKYERLTYLNSYISDGHHRNVRKLCSYICRTHIIVIINNVDCSL